MQNQLKNINENVEIEHTKNFLPVGRIRTVDSKVHIGRNQWLDEKVYNNVNNKSKNPKQFVGNVLVAVFGSEILQKSTITGRASNKMNSKEKFNQLDPTVVAACKDAYAHWLETLYAKIYPDYHHELEFANFNEYASKKISYLKRPPKVTKKRNKTSEGEQTESTSKRQKMNVTPDQTNNSENDIENEDKADENAEEGELKVVNDGELSSDVDDFSPVGSES